MVLMIAGGRVELDERVGRQGGGVGMSVGWVVGDVPRFVTEFDRADQIESLGVVNADRSGGFVADEEQIVVGIEGESIGEGTGRRPPGDLPGGGVDGDDLVGSGRCGVHDIVVGYCEHP